MKNKAKVKNLEILYISSVPSLKEFNRIKSLFKTGFIYGMNESGYKFHTLILEGMKKREDVNITAVVGRSVSHSTHKGLFWKGVKERTDKNLVYDHIGFINLPVIKHLMIGVGFFFKTLKFIIKNRKKPCAIVMDAAYITAHPFVLAAAGKKIHITAIFCDIYDYMADVKDSRNAEKVSLSRRAARKVAAKSYSRLNSFILLTEQMSEVVNKKDKPYIVMEGLVDVNMKEVPNILENKSPDKAVMYAGALREQYGLKNLVQGFMNYKNDDVRLWIFGAGDYSDDIEEAAKIDPRIVFGGMIPLSETVENELKATVLVNSRPTDMEFAKYSFPSKNMEYMVSGTPILTTRLPGMPQEYYKHIFTIDGNTPDDVTAALERVLSLSYEELHQKGLAGREFVLKNKNNVVQAGRILELIGYNKGEADV